MHAESALSTRRPLQTGVLQGSVLGPILYSVLYTHNIPTKPRKKFAPKAQSKEPELAVNRKPIARKCVKVYRGVDNLISWLYK